MPHSNQSDVTMATDYLKSTNAPQYVLDWDAKEKIDVVKTIMAVRTASKIVASFPRERALVGLQQKLRDASEESCGVAKRICFFLRALILNGCKNLETLDIIGYNANIPFGRRNGQGATIPLSPFSNLLKELNFKRWEVNPSESTYRHLPELTCTNVIWLLLEIPNLRRASLFASVENEDVNFLSKHSEVIELKKSSVEFLELDLLKLQDIPKEKVSSYIICDVLKFTKNLTSFSLSYLERIMSQSSLTQDVLDGLQGSSKTLKVIKLAKVNFSDSVVKLNHLFKFSKLEIFCFDLAVLLSMAMPLTLIPGLLRANKKRITAFPTTLKEIHLHFRADTWIDDIGNLSTDECLGRLINEHPKSSNLKTVVVESLGDVESGPCFDTRKGLKKVCQDAGINLVEKVSKIAE